MFLFRIFLALCVSECLADSPSGESDTASQVFTDTTAENSNITAESEQEPESEPEVPTILQVYHAIGDKSTFTLRATLEYTPSSLLASYTAESGLGDAELQDERDHYRVKIVNEEREAIASVPWSLLRKSRGEEYWRLHLDNEGRFFAFDYHLNLPPDDLDDLSKPDPADEAADRKLLNSFEPHVRIASPAVGKSPVLLREKPLPPGTKGDPTNLPEEQQSFFRKYWMYIVPLIIFLLMSGGATGDAAQAPAAASSGGATAGGSGGGRRR